MKLTRSVLLAAFLTGLMFAQQALTNETILKLVKAGMGDDVIVGMINTQATSFTLGSDDLIALKAAGVSDKVMGAMLSRNNAPAAAAATAPAPSALVSEIGVYYKKGGVWTDVEPEVVNFKSGGVLKSIATNGIIKGDMNGNIRGPHSKLELTTPVELLIYAPDGVAATEYQLLLLHEEKDSREFRTVTGGVFHKSGGASRDAIPFEGKKIAPRTYLVTLTGVKGGEYGLLPPPSGDATGSTGRLGKLYTFHIIE
jgi:hypothetical protein